MFSKLKRFLSVSLCLIFYIFLFAGNFGGNSCNASHGLDGSIRKFVPINISNDFNSNGIWGTDDSEWEELQASTESPKGVDAGAKVFYTAASDRNNGTGGLPADGKITIGNIPFNFNILKGYDNIKLSSAINVKTANIILGGIKVKNLYILGAAGSVGTANESKAGIKIYNENDEEIKEYAQELDVYDWCDTSDMDTVKGKDESSIVDYKGYYARHMSNSSYPENVHTLQCYRLNKFSGNTFIDKKINKFEINFTGEGSTENACFTIFAVTAEVEPDEDENITISDVKYNQLKIACGTSGEKQVKISTTEGANNEGIMENTAAFPYTKSGLDEGTTYYCTIYDQDKNAYYYFAVTTKKSLKIVVQAPSGLVYNGAAQQLIIGCSTLDANNAARPEAENTLLKANIYLRVMNAEGTPIHDTGWYNLNSLTNLTATNAGTYSVYYYLNEDNLSDYDLISANVVSDTGESTDTTTIEENGD